MYNKKRVTGVSYFVADIEEIENKYGIFFKTATIEGVGCRTVVERTAISLNEKVRALRERLKKEIKELGKV